jgi:hypothetical protein
LTTRPKNYPNSPTTPTYGIEIGVEDFTKDDFRTMADLLAMIKRNGGNG